MSAAALFEPWTCRHCTFRHDGAAAQFLACSVCQQPREDNSNVGSSISPPASIKRARPASDADELRSLQLARSLRDEDVAERRSLALARDEDERRSLALACSLNNDDHHDAERRSLALARSLAADSTDNAPTAAVLRLKASAPPPPPLPARLRVGGSFSYSSLSSTSSSSSSSSSSFSSAGAETRIIPLVRAALRDHSPRLSVDATVASRQYTNWTCGYANLSSIVRTLQGAAEEAEAASSSSSSSSSSLLLSFHASFLLVYIPAHFD